MSQEPYTMSFGGGLDLVTPPMNKKPGRVISSSNYEPRPGGYRRIDGIERFDGQPEPHLASYWVLNFDAGTAIVSEGNTVTGATSGATGKALIDAVIESGSYGGSDADGYLVLSEVSGTFQNNENLQVSAATKSVSDGIAVEGGASIDNLNDTWLENSIETRRALIAVVTGSGNMRGVWRYNGVSYAFRDNAGATAVDMWKSTSSGWSQCDLGHSISFTSGGTYVITEGNTITGATSSATGVVKRVIIDTGSFSGGDAVGRIIFYTKTGTFQSENLDVGGNLNVATIAGDSTANSLAVGGSFEFRNHNFLGSASSERMYGVDGVSAGFEWDGSVFVPIVTGMTADTPTHLIAHKKHLFFMFAGGSVQNSGIGEPYAWSVISGAAEIGIGGVGTGFNVSSGVLIIYSENRTHILYGNDNSDWVLNTLSEEAGAKEKSIQDVGGRLIHMDVTGIRDLSSTQAYGDFALGNLSFWADPWFEVQRRSAASITATMRVKKTNQYRVFYDNGIGMIMDLTSRTPQFLAIDYGMVVRCACSVEDSNGDEWILFGSGDGYVYRAEVGTSFDNLALSSFLRLPFCNMKSPRYEKRLHSAEVEGDFGPTTALSASADFGYGNLEFPSQQSASITVAGGGGFWGEAIWSEFYWGSQFVGQGKAEIEGIGENVSLVFASSDKYEESHTLHGVTLNYSMRKLIR